MYVVYLLYIVGVFSIESHSHFFHFILHGKCLEVEVGGITRS